MADGKVSMRCAGCGSREVTVEFDCRWDVGLQAWVPDEPDPKNPDGLSCWCAACQSSGDLEAAPAGEDEALEGSVP